MNNKSGIVKLLQHLLSARPRYEDPASLKENSCWIYTPKPRSLSIGDLCDGLKSLLIGLMCLLNFHQKCWLSRESKRSRLSLKPSTNHDTRECRSPLPAQSVSDGVCLTGMVKQLEVIISYVLQPTALS